MNKKLLQEKMKEVMSELGKISQKKSPRPHSHFVRMAKISAAKRKKLSTKVINRASLDVLSVEE